MSERGATLDEAHICPDGETNLLTSAVATPRTDDLFPQKFWVLNRLNLDELFLHPGCAPLERSTKASTEIAGNELRRHHVG